MAADPTTPRKRIPTIDDRRDLRRAFMAWTGDLATADDLAQETLLAAWASNRQPEHPDAWRPWLFGVARNILLRWRRDMAKSGQRTAPAPESERHLIAASAPDDLDDLLTRSDIVELLDAALGRLPAETRQALLLKYIDDLPQAAIADRLGMHEKALEGRLHRGKRAMHRFLVTEKPETAISLGIVSEPDTWVQTDLWCDGCGKQHLIGRRYDCGGFRLDCPSCDSWMGSARRSHVYSSFAHPAHVPVAGRRPLSFRKELARLDTELGNLAKHGLDAAAPCKNCGTLVHAQLWGPFNEDLYTDLHVRYRCGRCDRDTGVMWIPANRADDPFTRRWVADHPRTRMLRPRYDTLNNSKVLVSRWESVGSRSVYSVIRDTRFYRILAVEIDGRLIELS